MYNVWGGVNMREAHIYIKNILKNEQLPWVGGVSFFKWGVFTPP